MELNKKHYIFITSIVINIFAFLFIGFLFTKKQDPQTTNTANPPINFSEAFAPMPDNHVTHTESSHHNTQSNKKPTTPSRKSIDDNNLTSKTILEQYGDLVNQSTVEYFKHLRTMFPQVDSLDDHYNLVMQFLSSNYPEDEARVLLFLYKKYLTCEMDLKHERMKWALPRASDEWLGYMKKIYDHRINNLGKELADKLYGDEYRSMSYKLQKDDIVNDDLLYGHQKEQWLEEIARETWGNDYKTHMSSHNQTSFDQYKEKIQIYKKDLEEMNEEEKQARIKEFRKSLLSKDLVEKLEEADQMTAAGKTKISSYRATENQIMNDPKLTPDEKKNQLKKIQKQTFGDNAEAFQRAEAMRMALENAASNKK